MSCPPVVCELDGAAWGPGFYELTPAGRSKLREVAAAARANSGNAAKSVPAKRPLADREDGSAAVAQPPKVARVTDLEAVLGRNASAKPAKTMKDAEMIRLGMQPPPRTLQAQTG